MNGTVVSQSASASEQADAGAGSGEQSTEAEAKGDMETQSGEASNTENSESDEDADFSVGEIEGTYYENTFFGIRYTPSNGIMLQDEEYIKQLNATTAEYLADNSNWKNALDNGSVVTVAVATNADGTMNSNFIIQNASLMANLISEEALIDASIDVTQEGLNSLEMFDSVEVTKGKVNFLGEEHYCIDVNSKINGVGYYQKAAFLIKGKYALQITASSFDENGPQMILDDVTAIE